MAASRASASSLSRCRVTSTTRFTVPVSSPFQPSSCCSSASFSVKPRVRHPTSTNSPSRKRPLEVTSTWRMEPSFASSLAGWLLSGSPFATRARLSTMCLDLRGTRRRDVRRILGQYSPAVQARPCWRGEWSRRCLRCGEGLAMFAKNSLYTASLGIWAPGGPLTPERGKPRTFRQHVKAPSIPTAHCNLAARRGGISPALRCATL